MLSQGVDLAEKNSASVILDGDLNVVHEFNSLQFPSDRTFVKEIVSWLVKTDATFVEDVPPQMHDLQAKSAYRLQGRILQEVEDLNSIQSRKLNWIMPTHWQFYFGYEGKKRSGSQPIWCKLKVESYGYRPPSEIHGKILQDHRSAYLVSRYCQEKDGQAPRSSPRRF